MVASHAASPIKVQRMQDLGAEVRLVEGDIELAKSTARAIAATDGAVLIEDSENIDTCEGAATLGLELIQASASFDEVLLALGAGALATGVGFALKSASPSTRITCVQPAGAPAMTLSWRAKHVVTTEAFDTIADGVAGRIPLAVVLEDLIETADDAVLVSEQSIIRGMRMLYEHTGLATEPSAALGIAAILEAPERYRGQHLASIVCGSNVALSDFHTWIESV